MPLTSLLIENRTPRPVRWARRLVWGRGFRLSKGAFSQRGARFLPLPHTQEQTPHCPRGLRLLASQDVRIRSKGEEGGAVAEALLGNPDRHSRPGQVGRVAVPLPVAAFPLTLLSHRG